MKTKTENWKGRPQDRPFSNPGTCRSDWHFVKVVALLATILIPFALPLGCSRKQSETSPVAPEVLVTTVTSKDVPVVIEDVATLDGFINADINARVSGYIISRDYKEGSLVKKGDLLFQIDPRPFEAALAEAKATLANDLAVQSKAIADEKRAVKLFGSRVISPQERDAAVQAADSAMAAVGAEQAAVTTAELNLGYTRIIAPIDGVVGIAAAQVGDLVGPSTGVLTSISQADPIKAIATVGERPFTDLIMRHPDPDERDAYLGKLQFQLILVNGTVYPQKGKFYAADRNLDVKTGSIRYEVTFPNPGNLLHPGQFGRIRATVETRKGSLVVPQEAVTELQGSYEVAVVSGDNKVSIRRITVGERLDGLWEITGGLKAGEKVIVAGGEKVQDGALVAAKAWLPAAHTPVTAAVDETTQP